MVKLSSHKEIVIFSGHPLADKIANLTFPTKKETAEHYPFYFYVKDLSTWLAPRNIRDNTWDEIFPGVGERNWCPICGSDLDARGLCPRYPHKVKEEPVKTTRTNLDEKIHTSSGDPKILALRNSKIPWWTNTPLAVSMHQEIPRYWYHVGRGSKAKGIPAYKIREIEAADTFGLDYFKYQYVWLSPKPIYGPDAFIIDITKLDNANLRFTGQIEGNLLHKGDIPPKAIVGERGKPYN